MTPRFNPEVNGYWMCDIGRFDYHWIEGDERLRARCCAPTAPAAGADRLADALAKRAIGSRRRRRPIGAAILRVGPRVARGAVPDRRIGGALGVPEDASRSCQAGARSRSRRNTSSGFRPSTTPERQRRARISGSRPDGGDRIGCPTLSALRPRRGRAVEGSCRLRSGTGRIDRRRVVDHRAQRGRGSCSC